MIIKRKLFAKQGGGDDKTLAQGSLGAATIGAATIKTGKLTGRETRYHNTLAENVEKIKQEGIRAKFAEDPNNLTNAVLDDIDMSKKKGITYVSRNRQTANGVGTRRQQIIDAKNGTRSPNIFGTPDAEDMKGMLGLSKKHKTLKLKMDYDDILKRKVDNPEMRGAKTAEEFYQRAREAGKFMTREEAKMAFESLNNQTDCIKGDIESRYIVGGKGYKRFVSPKQVMKYAKKHPGRFGGEAAKVAAVTGVGAYGIKKGVDSYKKKK